MAAETPDAPLLRFNGVNGATGEYGLPPMSGDELAGFIAGGSEPENLEELRARHRQDTVDHLGVKEGVDPRKLAESGWGVIFTDAADAAVKEALEPLLRLRREQAGDRFHLYEGEDGYLLGGDSKTAFLSRHGAGPGPADPDLVPYYLLIVGGPAEIPFQFQSQLDVQYAVGRLHFDTAPEYAAYAESVVAAETGPAPLAPRLTLFGVTNPGDPATAASTRNLIAPLLEKLANHDEFTVEAVLGEEATKARLLELLGGGSTPALLFTASHGLEFPLDHELQLPHQGALLCQDWPGPAEWRKQVPQDFYLAGDDLAADASPLGLVAFHFACYGAGTPEHDEFSRQAFRERQAIAPHPFLSALPTRLLGHPHGGALAVIAHVERAWSYSFEWPGAGAQTAVFESAIRRLLDGYPVGAAVEFFNERYAELSTVLADELEAAEFGKKVDPRNLAGMWTANNDARGYVVLGDPAVRLAVPAAGEAPAERPAATVRGAKEPAAKSTGGRAAEPAPPPAADSAEPEVEDPSDGKSFAAPTGAADDEVRFSAFHPRAVEAGAWQALLVYAHLETALAAVRGDAGQQLGQRVEAYRRAEAEASAAVAPGTEITLVPGGEGLEFEPASATLTWSGSWQRADLEMRATGAASRDAGDEEAARVIEGRVSCYVGPLLIADVPISIAVVAPGETAAVEEAAPASASAGVYPAVFASYSHADTAVVEALETACGALGMDYLRDVTALKSGEDWSARLREMIGEADVFQLFWSAAASRSEFVEKEWRHALGLAEAKGGAFIRPVCWQQPAPPIPGELRHLHFAPVDFARFVEPDNARGESPAAAPPGTSAEPTPATAATAASSSTAGGPAVTNELMTLTVSTYLADDPAHPDGATLVARSKVAIGGDVETYVSPQAATEEHLALHHRMVREAIAGRIAYLEASGHRR